MPSWHRALNTSRVALEPPQDYVWVPIELANVSTEHTFLYHFITLRFHLLSFSATRKL